MALLVKSLSLLLFSCLFAPMVCQALPDNVLFDRYYTAALEKIETGDYAAANGYFNQIIEQGVAVPDDFSFYYGMSLLNSGHSEMARERLMTYLAATPPETERGSQALQLLIQAEKQLGYQWQETESAWEDYRRLRAERQQVRDDYARKQQQHCDYLRKQLDTEEDRLFEVFFQKQAIAGEEAKDVCQECTEAIYRHRKLLKDCRDETQQLLISWDKENPPPVKPEPEIPPIAIREKEHATLPQPPVTPVIKGVSIDGADVALPEPASVPTGPVATNPVAVERELPRPERLVDESGPAADSLQGTSAPTPDEEGLADSQPGSGVPVKTQTEVDSGVVEGSDDSSAEGWLGILHLSVTEDIAQTYRLEHPAGVFVAEVIAGSPAEKAGLFAGDIVLKYAAEDVGRGNFDRLIRQSHPGQDVELLIHRNGEQLVVRVTVGENDRPLVVFKGPKQGDFDRIYIENQCGKDVYTAVIYNDLDMQWQTRAWYLVAAGQKVHVGNTRNSVYYFYAESVDGITYWQKGEHRDQIGEKVYRFQKNTITSTRWGDVGLSLVCE